MRIIFAICFMLIALGPRGGAAAEPATTQPIRGNNIVEVGDARVTLLSVSSGVTFVGKDHEAAGDMKLRYVQGVFLVQRKEGLVGQMKINGKPLEGVTNETGMEHKVIQVDHARKHWPGVRMEKIPDYAKDTDPIFQLTHIGVAPLPAEFSLSIQVGEQTFAFKVLP